MLCPALILSAGGGLVVPRAQPVAPSYTPNEVNVAEWLAGRLDNFVAETQHAEAVAGDHIRNMRRELGRQDWDSAPLRANNYGSIRGRGAQLLDVASIWRQLK